MKTLLLLITGVWALAPSVNPPGLPVSQVPQFVFIGSDDNTKPLYTFIDLFKNLQNPMGSGNSGTYDGQQASMTFYSTTLYSVGNWLQSHREAYDMGLEIGNHTMNHPKSLNVETMVREIKGCENIFTTPTNNFKGIPKEDFVGFRVPFLHNSNAVFTALDSLNYLYDCSLEDGFQPEKDGRNFNWPYTLDYLPKGVWEKVIDSGLDSLAWKSRPNLWEIPAYPLLLIPDSVVTDYGLQVGFLDKVADRQSWMRPSLKITGLDYNLIYQAFLNSNEILAMLKYNLDLRLAGNRAPFTYGIHGHYYEEADKLSVLRDFLNYALSKPEVRVVSGRQIIDWMRNPVGLNGEKPGTVSLGHNAPEAIEVMATQLVFNTSFEGTIALFNSKGQQLFNRSGSITSGTYLQIPTGGKFLAIQNEYGEVVRVLPTR
jgi:hypothetical protein